MFLRKSAGVSPHKISTIGQDLKNLGVTHYCFLPNESVEIDVETDHEIVIVILEGNLNIEFQSDSINMLRNNVFDDLPEALIFPAGSVRKIKITASLFSRLVFCQCLVKKENNVTVGTYPQHIRKENIECVTRGKDNYQREVRNISRENDYASSLICGETISQSGNWSSYPPHKHDQDNPGQESAHEEVYLYTFSPPNGWAYQEIYSPKDGFNEVLRVEESDAVIIPFGYHPVVVAPGYKLHYFWVLAGTNKILQMYDDPNHSWIRDAKK